MKIAAVAVCPVEHGGYAGARSWIVCFISLLHEWFFIIKVGL